MTQPEWTGYNRNGASSVVPCDHMVMVDDLAITLLRGVVSMLEAHGLPESFPTFIHEATADIAGQSIYLACSWTAHISHQEVTDDDHQSPT